MHRGLKSTPGGAAGAASESESLFADPVQRARGQNSLEALLQNGRNLRAMRAAAAPAVIDDDLNLKSVTSDGRELRQR